MQDKFDKIQPLSHTLDSFLANPTGEAGNMAFNNKKIIQSYEHELHTLISSRKYNFKPLIIEDGEITYIHLKIPSGSVKDFYYDVVVEFTNSKNGHKLLLNDDTIRFYSNSPSFIYTYANAYLQHELVIPALAKKLPSEIATYSQQRNPSLNVGFEKTITLALLYIKHNGLLNKSVGVKFKSSMSVIKFKDQVINFSDSQQEYHAKKQIQKEEQEKQAKLEAKNGKVEDVKAKKSKVPDIESVPEDDITKENPMKLHNRKVDMRVKNKVVTRVNNKVINRKINMKVR